MDEVIIYVLGIILAILVVIIFYNPAVSHHHTARLADALERNHK